MLKIRQFTAHKLPFSFILPVILYRGKYYLVIIQLQKNCSLKNFDFWFFWLSIGCTNMGWPNFWRVIFSVPSRARDISDLVFKQEKEIKSTSSMKYWLRTNVQYQHLVSNINSWLTEARARCPQQIPTEDLLFVSVRFESTNFILNCSERFDRIFADFFSRVFEFSNFSQYLLEFLEFFLYVSRFSSLLKFFGFVLRFSRYS